MTTAAESVAGFRFAAEAGGSRGSLATTQPGTRQRLVAAAIMLVSAVAFLCMVPFARVQLARVPAVIAAYEGALFICDIVTAVLIAWQATQVRSRGLFILTAGYVFDAAIIVPHALSFPGLFTPAGLLGGGSQATAWLYMFWHGGYPLFVIAYAFVSVRDRDADASQVRVATPLIAAIAGAVVIAVALALLATAGQSYLPTLIRGDDYRPALRTGVSHGVWLLSLAAFLSLRPWKPRSILHLWMGMVMFAWMLDVGAAALVGSSRFDVGFYVGRMYGLCAATLVLITLLLEVGRVSAGLAAAREAEGRARVLAQIVDAQEHERQRIARELHDEMGTYLTGMKAGLDLIAQKYGSSAVGDLQKLLSQADDAVDTLALELRPPTLDDIGVDRAIRNLAERFSSATGIRVDVHVRNRARLPEAVETTLYRVVQEALTNARKHSGAKSVSIILDQSEDDVRLIVEDDGRGFDADETTRIRGRSRLGLRGMRERVRLVDGTISIESSPGLGTTVYVRVPLPPSEVTV